MIYSYYRMNQHTWFKIINLIYLNQPRYVSNNFEGEIASYKGIYEVGTIHANLKNTWSYTMYCLWIKHIFIQNV